MVRIAVPLVFLLAAACGAKDADYDPANLSKRFEAIRAGLEAALGETCGDPPVFAIAGEEEIARVVAKENTYFQARVRGGPRGAALFIRNTRQAQALAPVDLAKFDIETGRILVNPGAFEHVACAAPEFRPVRSAPFLDLLLIHEAVHLWQHRRYGMGKFIGQPRTQERILCRKAVLEGHAQHVTAQAATILGLEEEFALLQRLNSEVPSSVRDPGVRHVFRALTTFFAFHYVEGRSFVDAVVKDLGREAALTRLFTDPPDMVRHVGRPEEYLRGDRSGEALRAAARKIGRLVRKPFMRIQTIALTEAMVRKNLALADPDVVDAAMSRYVDGIAVITTKGSLCPSMEYIVAVVELDLPAGADTFLELERKVDRAKNVAFAKPGGTIRIEDPSHQDLEVEGRPAFYSEKRVTVGTAPPTRVRNLVVQSRHRIIEVTVQGADHCRDELEKLVPKILAILEGD